MRVKAATVQKFLLGLALLAALAWNLSHASEIKGLELRDGATGTRAEIALDREATYKVIHLKGPDRLVIDLPASSLAKGFRLPSAAGVVKSVRTGEPAPGTARIVFDLAQPVAVLKPRIEQGASGPRLVLEWPGDGAGAEAVAAAPSMTPSVTTAPGSTPPPTSSPASSVAAAQADAPKFDPAASSAATTRLISEIVERNTATTTTAAAGASPVAATATASAPPSPAADPAAVPATAAPNTTAATTAAKPPVATTIATGIPTRIATGQPTPMSGV
ncbi:MAG TPA: AMIN domain-containing protein, partial [Lysobacter sp.]